MDFTAMPEAAIHKDCQSPVVKNEIRLSENLLISSPSAQAELAKNADQTKLGRKIAVISHLRHDFRALALGKNV
ncbi:hypothetical protein ACVW1B_007251 [Bradyrhizobium sp. USDA 4502]